MIEFCASTNKLVSATPEQMRSFLRVHGGWTVISREQAEREFSQFKDSLCLLGVPVAPGGHIEIATGREISIPLCFAIERLEEKGEVFDYPPEIIPFLAQSWMDFYDEFPYARRFKTERLRRKVPDGVTRPPRVRH